MTVFNISPAPLYIPEIAGKFYGSTRINRGCRRFARYLTKTGWERSHPYYGTQEEIRELIRLYPECNLPVTQAEIQDQIDSEDCLRNEQY